MADAKPGAHGLLDADAFVAAHDADATLLVLDATGPLGSGGGQLAHPTTSFTAATFRPQGDPIASPSTALFGGAAAASAVPFTPAGGGVSTATASSAALDPGTHETTVTLQEPLTRRR